MPVEPSQGGREVVVPIGADELRYRVEGETAVGPDVVLLDHDDDLLDATAWAEQGFGVARFLEPASYRRLVAGLTDLVADTLAGRGATTPAGFTLADYHHQVDDDLHQEVIGDLFRDGIEVERLAVPIEEIEERASECCRVAVSTRCPDLDARRVFVRMVRPGSRGDHNPPHRDVWLDHLRSAVNGYAPLAGSTSRSSLGLVPGSHRWSEAAIERTTAGAEIDGIRYEVPAVVRTDEPLELVRPATDPNELLLFSPYLVHGGAQNFERDATRASLELRFWRAA